MLEVRGTYAIPISAAFSASSFEHIDAYLIGLHDCRVPLVDMSELFPRPDFERINAEITHQRRNLGELGPANQPDISA